MPSVNNIKVGKNAIQGEVNVIRIKPFCYVLSGEVLTGEMCAHGWAHAKVVEQDGCVTINPFNRRSTPSAPPDDNVVKSTKVGSVRLLPSNKVAIRITLDRGKDSPDEFIWALTDLLGDNFTNEIIKFELEKQK